MHEAKALLLVVDSGYLAGGGLESRFLIRWYLRILFQIAFLSELIAWLRSPLGRNC